MANCYEGGQAKAFAEDANVAPSTASADAAAGGVAGIGPTGTLAELQSQLSPFTYTSA
ncbi:conserved hypothetical protein [Mesorhizobium sp. ORS 3359]|nr:conserved hypothetical protein [Mesorhizobium sp. ORS 3359]